MSKPGSRSRSPGSPDKPAVPQKLPAQLLRRQRATSESPSNLGDAPVPESPPVKDKLPPLPSSLKGKQAALVESHIPFVYSVARKLHGQMPHLEFEDLVGFGMAGLLEAAQRYDERHGAVFITFAYYRVRGAIFDGVRSMGWLPRSEYAKLRIEERTASYLEALGSRQGKQEGTKEAVEEQIRDLSDALSGVATVFVTLLSGQQEEALIDHQPAAQEQLEHHQLSVRVRRALNQLPEKERGLIEAYYFGDQTLEQVGAKMGLSKSWTSRLHARAVATLREHLMAEGLSSDDA